MFFGEAVPARYSESLQLRGIRAVWRSPSDADRRQPAASAAPPRQTPPPARPRPWTCLPGASRASRGPPAEADGIREPRDWSEESGKTGCRRGTKPIRFSAEPRRSTPSQSFPPCPNRRANSRWASEVNVCVGRESRERRRRAGRSLAPPRGRAPCCVPSEAMKGRQRPRPYALLPRRRRRPRLPSS